MIATQLSLLDLLARRRVCPCGAKPHEHTEIGRSIRRPPACNRTILEAKTLEAAA